MQIPNHVGLIYSVHACVPKKYPYNNRIISIEGTFLGDTLYKIYTRNFHEQKHSINN
jgi:hypothetical protein